MKWSRFFWMVGFLLIVSAGNLALIWYGVPEWLDGFRLMSVATGVFVVSITGLALALIIPAVKGRWWRRPINERLVRQRLGAFYGAFYYVVWGVLILNLATYMAITLRSHEIKHDLSGPFAELNRLFQAMSTVSLTLIFACLFLMILFSRYVHDEGSGASGDQ